MLFPLSVFNSSESEVEGVRRGEAFTRARKKIAAPNLSPESKNQEIENNNET